VDNAVSALTVTENFRTNIMDDNNIWVTVNPYNGAVSSSQVQSTTAPAPGIFAPNSLDARMAQARMLATNQLQSQPAVE
jgi:hypothetical protein